MKSRSSQRQILGAVNALGRCLPAALSLLNSGCATGSGTSVYMTQPPPPAEEVRAQLGLISVVGTELGSTEFARPMGKGRSAGQGALEGFVLGPMAGGAAGGGYGFVAGLFLAPVTATGGAIYGAFAGMNKKEYAAITNTLQKVVREATLPARLQSGCVEAIHRLAPQILLAPTNAPAAATQTTLEIALLQFGLKGQAEINPPMRLNCAVQVRFVRAGDGAELFKGQFNYFGATHELRQWAANDGAEFRKGTTDASKDLVGQIVERLFLVYDLPGSFVETRTMTWDTQK